MTTLTHVQPATIATGTALDVTFEEAAVGRVRLSAHLPLVAPATGRPPDPRIRVLELATTAALRSVVGTGGYRLLAEHVVDLDDHVAGTVTVVAEQVHAGPRMVVVRATLLDAAGVPCGQSVVSAGRSL